MININEDNYNFLLAYFLQKVFNITDLPLVKFYIVGCMYSFTDIKFLDFGPLDGHINRIVNI